MPIMIDRQINRASHISLCAQSLYNHMRNLSKEPNKNYFKSSSPARPLSLGKPLQELKTNEVQVGIYKYNNDQILGKGYSSKVFKGVQIANVYKRYAIKVVELKKFRGSSLQMLQAQIDIHKNLVHQNVLRLYEIIKTPYFYYLILEYCPHGNLHEYIRQKKRLTEVNAIEIMSQILEGYNYLSGQNIIHRDLKPANILRVGNKWKISDFGFAVKSKYGFKDRINVGTPLYMPPQTLVKTYYSNKTDIFALGVIFYEMIEGRTPWESSNEKELIQKLKKELVLPYSIRHPKARELITKCCQLNESKRMSKDQLLSFSFKSTQEVGSNVVYSSRGGSSSNSKIRSGRKSSFASETVLPTVDPKLQIFKHNCQRLNLQYQFTQNLYTCVKNKDSFLFVGQSSEIFTVAIFKLSLRLLRQLCDKNKNHFRLKNWQQFSTSIEWQALACVFSEQLQKQQKQYLQYIKHFQIKIIRTVNRKFMDLSSPAPVAQKFYLALKFFIVPLLRQHNHELMMLYLQKQKDSSIRLNDKIQALDALFTIYNVCDIRITAQQLSISEFKVLEDFKNSQLTGDDYMDIRRLIRSI